MTAVNGPHYLDAFLIQPGYLVFHEGDEGRKNQRHTLAQKSRQLEGQRFSRSGGQHAQHIFAGQQVADDLLLSRYAGDSPEFLVIEQFLQCGQQRGSPLLVLAVGDDRRQMMPLQRCFQIEQNVFREAGQQVLLGIQINEIREGVSQGFIEAAARPLGFFVTRQVAGKRGQQIGPVMLAMDTPIEEHHCTAVILVTQQATKALLEL